MAKAPVEVATPKFELVTCVKKWMSRMADGVESVCRMLLLPSARPLYAGKKSSTLQSQFTYTLSPSTCTKIKLPLRCWFLALTLPSCGALPAASLSSDFSRLYVPIIAYCGLSGKNSMQLGGRSSLNDVSDLIEDMLLRMVGVNLASHFG